MRSHKQLSQAQRHQIDILKKAGGNQEQVAESLFLSAGTTCRELQRDTGKKGHRPEQAQVKADTRRKQAAKAVKTAALAIALVEGKIGLDWSPGQVAGWLAAERGFLAGHGRPYRHIWADQRRGGTLYPHLRQSGKKRKKRYAPKDKRGQTRNRVSIDGRPTIGAGKTRLGDWGIDTVIGKNHRGP